MKTIITRCLLAVSILFLLTACEKMRYDSRETWRIASTTSFEAALSAKPGQPMSEPVPYSGHYLYKVQIGDGTESNYWRILRKDQWQTDEFDGIYEEGYEYIVEVRCHHPRNIITYAKFEKVVSKVKKDSDVTPDTIYDPWIPD